MAIQVPVVNQRPWLMRICPPRWRESLFYRLYLDRFGEFTPLYRGAALEFALNIYMWNLVPGDIISGCIALGGIYEWYLSRRIVAMVRCGSTRFVDVGANMGYFSLLWASLSDHARVTAVEPVARNVALLTANRDGNGLRERIKIVAAAASDSKGQISFAEGPADQTGWGGIAASGATQVPCVRLDEVIGDEFIDLLKIDVEGAEALVLSGARRLLEERRIRRIVFENNLERAAEHTGDCAKNIVEAYGFSCVRLGRNQGMWWAELAP
ncbi:MAG: hypothetical protein JWR69_2155 [Pedosphaera sp.]|nr:hypothetical protein [Pedosphaera sp.]